MDKLLIHKNLCEAVKASGLCTKEIAKRLGITCATMNRYMESEALPSIGVFLELCKILGVSSSKILGLNI